MALGVADGNSAATGTKSGGGRSTCSGWEDSLRRRKRRDSISTSAITRPESAQNNFDAVATAPLTAISEPPPKTASALDSPVPAQAIA